MSKRTASPRTIPFYFASICLLVFGSVSHGALISDPTGDTLGSGAIQHDITQINVEIVGTDLRFTVTFAGSIAPPSDFAAASVAGYIDLDADGSALTGVESNVDRLTSIPTGLGVDYFIDIFSEAFQPGFVDLIDASTVVPVGSPLPILFTSDSFSVSVPRSSIGGAGDSVRIALLMGTATEATDVYPNPSQSAVPEPTTLAAFALAFGCLFAFRRRSFSKP